MTTARRRAPLLFSLFAATVAAALWTLSRLPGAELHSTLVARAILFDLVITVPLAYYLLMVRAGRASLLTLVPVVLASVRGGIWLLADPIAQAMPRMGLWLLPLELVTIGGIVWRLRQTAERSPDAEWDMAVQIERMAARLLPKPAAALAAGELAVFYYALFAWRTPAEVAAEGRPFSYREPAGINLLVTLLICAIVFEGGVLHLLISRSAPAVALVLLAVDLYTLLWAIGLLRAARLRPFVLTNSALHLRFSLLWTVSIARENIVSMERINGPAPDRRTPGYLQFVFVNDTQWMLTLAEPVAVHGLYGRTRTVSRIGLALDDGETLAKTLRGSSLK